MTRARVVEEVAGVLRDAEARRVGVTPLVETYPGLDLDTAYAIQLENVRQRLAAGARVAGHKVGLTSKAMQETLGVDQPDYGHLLDDMVHASGEQVSVGRFVAPRVEPEIAFVLAETLGGPGCDADAVLGATRSIVPALELIDSRIVDWRIGLLDTIADNASSAAVVLGSEVPLDRDLDFTTVVATLRVDGRVVARGGADAVLGHPANAVAWLVNVLHQRGVSLAAGQVVMPGSCTKAVDAVGGTKVEAEFTNVGAVCVELVA